MPARLCASTGAWSPVPPYRVRVSLPDTLVAAGVDETPSTFVHCSTASPKLAYASVVSCVPCHSCTRGRLPV